MTLFEDSGVPKGTLGEKQSATTPGSVTLFSSLSQRPMSCCAVVLNDSFSPKRRHDETSALGRWPFSDFRDNVRHGRRPVWR